MTTCGGSGRPLNRSPPTAPAASRRTRSPRLSRLDVAGYAARWQARQELARAWSVQQGETPLILAPICLRQPFAAGADLGGAEDVQRILASLRLVVAVNLLGLPAAAVSGGPRWSRAAARRAGHRAAVPGGPVPRCGRGDRAGARHVRPDRPARLTERQAAARRRTAGHSNSREKKGGVPAGGRARRGCQPGNAPARPDYSVVRQEP